MTIVNGYATLAEYKAWIIPRGSSISTDSADDAVIESMIEMASRYIDAETGRKFYLGSADETRYYTAENAERLRIDDFGSITSVSVDYSGDRVTYKAFLSSDYDTLPANAALDGIPFNGLEMTIFSGEYFPTFPRAIKVVGKIGYPSVPKDINNACLSITQNLNGTRSGQTSQGKVTITGAGIVIRPEDVPAFAQKVIQHYRDYT